MADEDRIRVQNPESGGVFETTRGVLRDVWAKKGWVEVAPDTPLTDQRYVHGDETEPITPASGEPAPTPAPPNGRTVPPQPSAE